MSYKRDGRPAGINTDVETPRTGLFGRIRLIVAPSPLKGLLRVVVSPVITPLGALGAAAAALELFHLLATFESSPLVTQELALKVDPRGDRIGDVRVPILIFDALSRTSSSLHAACGSMSADVGPGPWT